MAKNKKLLFKTPLVSANALSYQYNKTLLKKKYAIKRNISFDLENKKSNNNNDSFNPSQEKNEMIRSF